MSHLQIFGFSYFITISFLGLALWYGGWPAFYLTTVLAVLEVSLSFDNAVVNAKVLEGMSQVWRQRFLTWGILFAVVGVRLVLPVVIVALATGLGCQEVIHLAMNNSAEYAKYLQGAHPVIAAFGGIFLLMVALDFLIDPEKETHWLSLIEKPLSKVGKVNAMATVIALSLLILIVSQLDKEIQIQVLIAGNVGLITYLGMAGLSEYLSSEEEETKAPSGMTPVVVNAGLVAFLYLQVLDASFSLDGVIGAFAISQDIWVIMLGLGIGAIFVRSMTIYLVEKKSLAQFVFLDHGAHYAILALAVLILCSIQVHISEVISGTVGIVFIVLSLYSSVRTRGTRVINE